MKIYKSKSANFVFKMIKETTGICLVSPRDGDSRYIQVGTKFHVVIDTNAHIELSFQNYLNEIENDN